MKQLPSLIVWKYTYTHTRARADATVHRTTGSFPSQLAVVQPWRLNSSNQAGSSHECLTAGLLPYKIKRLEATVVLIWRHINKIVSNQTEWWMKTGSTRSFTGQKTLLRINITQSLEIKQLTCECVSARVFYNIDITCCCKFWHFRHCCEQNWIHERQPVLWWPLLWSQSSVRAPDTRSHIYIKTFRHFPEKISFKFRSNLVLEWFAEGVVEGKLASVWNQNNSKGKIASQWQTCKSNLNYFSWKPLLAFCAYIGK